MPTTFAFIADLPTSVTLAHGRETSRIQIAKTGKFKDPRYGDFAITTAMFDKWESNFTALSSPAAGRKGVPIDFDHSPEKRGDTEAAGWIVGLDRMGKDGSTRTPNELWAEVQWTQLGIDAIKDDRYAYISPSYHPNWVDEQGKGHGNTLVGSALTNRPFLRMATVSLSAAAFAVEDTDTTSDSPVHMPELTVELLTSLGLSGETATTVLAAENPGAALKVALAEVAKSEPAPTPAPDPVVAGGKTLSELAKEQGMVIMSGADVAKLAADASRGAAAADALHTQTFSRAWDQAVKDGKVLPASKDTFELAYGAAPEATLKQLCDLPTGTIKVKLEGSGASGDDAATTLSTRTRDEMQSEVDAGVRIAAPDLDRDKMATRLDALVAEGKSEDEAIVIVEREFAGQVA